VLLSVTAGAAAVAVYFTPPPMPIGFDDGNDNKNSVDGESGSGSGGGGGGGVSGGGSVILQYRAVTTPGGFTATAATSPIVVAGLSTSTAYSFVVFAVNIFGESAASATSGKVAPSSSTPSPPRAVGAVAADAAATVVFSPPTNAAATVVDYTVTATPGGHSATAVSSVLFVCHFLFVTYVM
jgi:hypothetical protein